MDLLPQKHIKSRQPAKGHPGECQVYETSNWRKHHQYSKPIRAPRGTIFLAGRRNLISYCKISLETWCFPP
jgi:hypothetical protein